jgi:hypothetical protein
LQGLCALLRLVLGSFWLISDQRLYLFGREENRDAFAAAPAGFLRQAKLRWPALEQDLAQ